MMAADNDVMNIRIISAGAGSGKTYRLTSELVNLLKNGVRPSGTIATTFTNKAAAELQERVRIRLLEEGLPDKAEAITNALIGTVHSLGVKLLKRFAFEAGVSPDVSIMAEEDQQMMFNQSLAVVLNDERVQVVEDLCDKLGLNKRGHYDWRKEVKQLTDVSRINDFSFEVLEESKRRSFDSFLEFLDPPEQRAPREINEVLAQKLDEAIMALSTNEDGTKKTNDALSQLKQLREELTLRGLLFWHHWVKISKLSVGAKSKDAMSPLKDFVQGHLSNASFHGDVKSFIDQIFEISVDALREYEQYKKSRGLIDYTDMEVKINQLLENGRIQRILAEEIDLLMVDEFQDTSPIQLEIFLKLSRLAGKSIWVGDPKQSIYGFRGAEPELMQAIIRSAGGVKPEDIQEYSWRSREDIVFATNAIFTKAFSDIPSNQVALKPKRTKISTPDSINNQNEPIDIGDALIHWHFEYDGPGRRSPRKPWMENCIARSIQELLEQNVKILPKGEAGYRLLKPGDIAVLCRSNMECQAMAEALARAGLKVSIARSGLLETAEAKGVLACLKYILNRYDTLSVAEILVLISHQPIERVIEGRRSYLEDKKAERAIPAWASDDPFIAKLNALREEAKDLTSAEILNLVLEELNIRQIIAGWGSPNKRLDNIEELRKFAVQYEENCNRLHLASSLGGFLLWLNAVEKAGNDTQGAGQSIDAVNVMTYHKSKGLEWPVVVCHSLEGALKARVWGVRLINESQEIDLDNVLGNRWIRYWINPYGDQIKNTLLDERIKEHQVYSSARQQALMEDARLLYVGVTRARDYLVLPSRDVPTRWLNRVWHRGEEDHPTLDASTYESPWEWQGFWLPKHTETKVFAPDFEYREIQEAPIFFLEAPSGKQQFETSDIDLRTEELFPKLKITTGLAVTYQGAWEPTFNVEAYDLAKALKAFLIADADASAQEEREEMARSFIQTFDLGDFTPPHLFVQQSNHWKKWLNRTYTPTKVLRKYPIRYSYRDRWFNTIVDLILETPEGLILIQNSGYTGQQKNWRKKAKELAPWMLLCRMALQEMLKVDNVRTYVHFVLGGGVMEIMANAQVDVPVVEKTAD